MKTILTFLLLSIPFSVISQSKKSPITVRDTTSIAIVEFLKSIQSAIDNTNDEAGKYKAKLESVTLEIETEISKSIKRFSKVFVKGGYKMKILIPICCNRLCHNAWLIKIIPIE